MIHLGDRLGLYRAMADAGPLRAEELAERTGLQSRWLLEWLRCQAAAGLVRSEDGETFELPAEAVPVLVEEQTSEWFSAGAFFGNVIPPEATEALVESFRTGMGLTYEQLGPSAAHGLERMLAPWTRQNLVPVILPALEGVVGRLEAGARVVDVGCGGGLALTTMAAAFPRSVFEGWDPSSHAISEARRKCEEMGLANATFRQARAQDLPSEPTWDLVITLDCLHDMARPYEAAAAIRRSIKADGTWLIKEIRSYPRWEQNLKNPLLAMLYGTSVATCMSSGLSEPGGAGLGTLGLNPDRLGDLCRAAGFSSVRVHDLDDPANLYYEVRP